MAYSAPPKGIAKVIAASSVGTLIEWYDFYIFGSLATVISTKFFPADNPTAALLSTLAAFAAGFIVRPFGALVFGRLGDIVGRKYTFLLTLILMGGSTFLIGVVPGYETIGWAAPLLIVLLRLLQGLALGGEYGGAATYVSEHSPAHRRGFFTSFIQTTATIGLFVSLLVIMAVRRSMSEEAFADYGWRIPFLLSIILVGVSIYIRLRMEESPLFAKIKKEGKISTNPLKESFGKKGNLKMVLLALFGAAMGQGVVWYTGQFYAQSFIQNTLRVDFDQTISMLTIALLAATPFFILFGALSDRVGRKVIMLTGMALAVLFYRPIYTHMYNTADLTQKTEVPGMNRIEATTEPAESGNLSFRVQKEITTYDDGTEKIITTRKEQVKEAIHLGDRGYWIITLMIFIQVIFVTMVYGPIAAFLVELFPTRIRYTSMSLPYHIGNGIFGGLTPLIATRLVNLSGDANEGGTYYLAGLWYPIGVAAVCFFIGLFYMKNKIDENVLD